LQGRGRSFGTLDVGCGHFGDQEGCIVKRRKYFSIDMLSRPAQIGELRPARLKWSEREILRVRADHWLDQGMVDRGQMKEPAIPVAIEAI
jgi:hypothetical protein